MSARAAFPEGSHEVLAARLREVKTKAEFQRVQAVWLRVTLELSDEQIAQAVGLSAHTVRCLSSRFRRQGVSALVGMGRGGQRHENLSVTQEQTFLEPFLDSAGRGHLLQVSPIKTAYEPVVGHPVPPSTIDRLLGRYGWRKLAPRPQAFKKIARTRSGRRAKPRTSRSPGSIDVPRRSLLRVHQQHTPLLGASGRSTRGRRTGDPSVHRCLRRRQSPRWDARRVDFAAGQQAEDVAISSRGRPASSRRVRVDGARWGRRASRYPFRHPSTAPLD